MKVLLKTNIDNTLKAIKDIKGLEGMDVLVGITEETSKREEGEVNNAQLVAWHTKGVRTNSMRREMNESIEAGETYNSAMSMYITSHGSPLWKIQPRPIIEPAIEASGNKERIAEDLKIAAEAMLAGESSNAIDALHKAGTDAMNIIKLWFDDTRNNWPDISDKTKKAKGSNKILVDSSQMKNAITYVVDLKGK
jgi:hypothetical protein